MGWKSDLFGGSSSTTKNVSYLPAQRKTLEDLLGLYSGEIGTGQQSYTAPRIAPLTADQQAATGGLGSYIGQFKATPDPATYANMGSSLQGLLTGESGASAYTPQAIDNYYRESIEKPAMQQWGQYIKPGIEEQYSGPGYWGSSRAKAVTEGSRDLGNWLGSQRSELEWNAGQANRQIEESKANRALSALTPAANYLQTPQNVAGASLQGLSQVATLSGLNQQQAQAEINAAIQQFAEENRLTDPEDMQILMQLLGMNYSSGISRSESSQGEIAGWAGLAGRAGGAISGMSGGGIG